MPGRGEFNLINFRVGFGQILCIIVYFLVNFWRTNLDDITSFWWKIGEIDGTRSARRSFEEDH